MLRTVCDALRTAARIASATLVSLLPTTSVSRYTWSLTMPPGRTRRCRLRPWHDRGPQRASAYVAGWTAPTDVRTFRAPEYVVRRIRRTPGLRRLRDVPHRHRRSPPMSVMTVVPAPRTASDSCTEEDGRGVLDALAGGDEATWSATVRQFDGLLRSAARVVLRSDADVDEAVQRTWVLLFGNAG